MEGEEVLVVVPSRRIYCRYATVWILLRVLLPSRCLNRGFREQGGMECSVGSVEIGLHFGFMLNYYDTVHE